MIATTCRNNFPHAGPRLALVSMDVKARWRLHQVYAKTPKTTLRRVYLGGRAALSGTAAPSGPPRFLKATGTIKLPLRLKGNRAKGCVQARNYFYLGRVVRY